jgi:hypothetical protein
MPHSLAKSGDHIFNAAGISSSPSSDQNSKCAKRMQGINRSMFLIRNKHGKCVKQERKPLSLQILEEQKKIGSMQKYCMSPHPPRNKGLKL